MGLDSPIKCLIDLFYLIQALQVANFDYSADIKLDLNWNNL